MNITFERYTDNWGAKIALSMSYNMSMLVRDDMNADKKRMFWNGEMGKWTISDNPESVTKLHEVLANHDAGCYGLNIEDCVQLTSARAFYSAPDKLILEWDFQPNWKDINSSMKTAAAGNAKWMDKEKRWMIPIATAMAVANAVRPHFAPLADVIENNEYVKQSHAATLQRVELSSAVDTDIELPMHYQYEMMRDYQKVAPVMYMTGGRKRILIADEMGLGKSLQALGCATIGEHERVLIVCPSIVKHNWANEIEKWLGGNTSSFIINGWEGAIEPARFNIINYDVLGKRLEHLLSIDYDCIIFDEVHRIKDQKTQTTKAALKLAKGKDGIIALSGTPITNRPSEFFTSLNMMLPATFANFFTFAKKYCNAKKNTFGWDYSGASNIEKSRDGVTTPLNHILRDFMLRRSMDDPRIAEEMPDLVETIINLELPPEAIKAYKVEYNSWMEEWVQQQANFGSSDAGFTLNMMTELRHIAGRLKVDAAVKWATTYYEQNEKPLVIFAHHKDVLKQLADRLTSAAMITGDTSSNNRQIIIDGFQTGGYRYLICSTNAMREGINLERANTTLFVEREWVPAWEQQAAARVRRMTQEESTCHKVIMSANDTIDSMFDQVVAEKADLVQRILDGESGKTRDAIGKALLEKLKDGLEVMI